MAAVGDRVGALMSAGEGVVKVFGFGVRVEDKVPPANAGGFGAVLHQAGATNPCLKLDSGKEVFGCECWWGPEDAIKRKFEDCTFEEVDIDEARAEAAKRSESE